ncbi:MAG: c-type cytochrome biogenesis protein CcsB [Desulfobulbaceae bacterium]|nr:c-type cytochrome biogenesis protein CcsB [Desulfobulbaceae bacterium]
MDSSTLLGITTLAYLFSAVFYIALLVYKNKTLGTVALIVTIAGILAQTGGIGMRWFESYELNHGHAPLTNMYESLVFFAWCVMVIYVFIEFKFKNKILGAFVTPLGTVAMAYATFMLDADIRPLMPALQSNWLIAHVVTCFIGYAAFAAAAGFGIMYLIRKSSEKNGPSTSSLPALSVIDDLNHKTLLFGFLWLSAGIITGAVWANEAWGTYWQWDPKETWSIITWFIYACTLHARFTRGWGGNRIAWLAILGFLAVFFTYFGVNLWLSGLHSYGGS